MQKLFVAQMQDIEDLQHNSQKIIVQDYCHSNIENVYETLKQKMLFTIKVVMMITKLNCLLKPKKRKISDGNDLTENCGNKHKKVTIRSPESSRSLGINLCMICEERINYENLIAAGTKHASSSKVKTFLVDSFT